MSPATLRTPASASACDTGLERLAQDRQDVAAALRQPIEKQNTMVRKRPFARQLHLPGPDQPHVRDRMVRRPKRVRRDEIYPVVSESSDAREAGGFNGFGEV
jgi:hypothetical protein